jgi:predicted ester cyclase
MTRRGFVKGTVGTIGAGIVLHVAQSGWAVTHDNSALERNKSLALRFKKAQGQPDQDRIIREVLAPDYKRVRGGMFHLERNAREQGFPGPGSYLRDAIPDRVDVIEEVIAEGEHVGLLFRITGTHQGNLFGIPPTGRKIDVYEAAIFRIAGDKLVEGWFMADEAGLLKQLGASMPLRKDGKRMVPSVTGVGEDPDTVLQRLQAGAQTTREDQNRLRVARSKGAAPPATDRAADFKQLRQGFQHMRDYGMAKGVAAETPTRALPDRRDLIDGFIAEGETVWMRFKIAGTQTGKLYGVAPTGKRIEAEEIGIMKFQDGKWKSGWYFGDELALMLQLDALHMLQS